MRFIDDQKEILHGFYLAQPLAEKALCSSVLVPMRAGLKARVHTCVCTCWNVPEESSITSTSSSPSRLVGQVRNVCWENLPWE